MKKINWWSILTGVMIGAAFILGVIFGGMMVGQDFDPTHYPRIFN